jgi:CO/xanthine dehydrogenase Mo-binding subunit
VRLTLWDGTQAPHNARDALARYLGLEADEVRVIVPDVGGGFGPRGRVYPEEYVVAALALHLARPVRFVATRTEDLLTTAHGRGQVHYARLAARADGTVLGLRDHIIQDAGAYTPSGVIIPLNTARHLMGPYRMPALEVRITGVYTNRVISSPLRGGGRPQGIYVIERLMDRLAARLGLDRAEIRRRNLLQPDEFPYDTGMPALGGTTVVYDSGNYPAYLQRALEAIGYDDFRWEQGEARQAGRYLGLGLAAFVESTGGGSEGARVAIREDGTISVAVGSPSNGQGHATTFAQMAAERGGAPIDAVHVTSGDTGAFPWGTGTFASRMGQYGGNAVSLAAQAVRARALQLAADLLEISPHDLDMADGRIGVKGVPERSLSLAQVAQEAAARGETLEESRSFQPSPGNTYAGGVNAAVVEVDVETGHVSILRYLVIHDSGIIVNPMVVEGQVHGGVAHGIGNALHEAFVYGEYGQPATATLADYSIPGAGDVPKIEIIHFETPSPFNPEGIKGAGEGGTIVAIPTLVSAVEDALSPFGIEINDVPMQKETIALAVARARISE